MRRTKIICTLGPAVYSPERIVALINAGMDVARVNFSHGTPEEHSAAIRTVRDTARAAGKFVAILQDLQGPKIRVGKLRGGKIALVPGKTVVISAKEILGTEERFSTTYEHFVADVRPKQIALLDDGLMKLRIDSVSGDEAVATVIDGGTLREHKGINLPETVLHAPSLTEKDKKDAAFGLKLGVDYIALSFVRSANDIKALRDFIAAALPVPVPVIAKIEKPQAIENIDRIVGVSDGVMVARGDLGVEIPPQDVPMIQKQIIRACNNAGKPVITATQMLESMVRNPRPTRAEASDVANAVLDGTDAVMLSEETSVGAYPVETVAMMAELCEQAERAAYNERPRGDLRDVSAEQAVARSACALAAGMNAAAILSLTHSGATARLLSQCRPSARIVGVTAEETIARRMALYWGVESMMIDSFRDTDTTLDTMRAAALAAGIVRHGDEVIFTGGHPLTEKARTNFIKISMV